MMLNENIEVGLEMVAEAFLSGDWDYYSDVYKEVYGRRPHHMREEWNEYHGK